jgi:quercetin dioxygenase-like cupin family protein
MAKITFVHPEEQKFIRTADLMLDRKEERYTRLRAEASENSVWFRHPGSDSELQMFEVRLEPSYIAAPHAHASDEIIVVVDGEIWFGAQRCGPGTSVCIPGNTLYGFKAGPNGARFMNFRPRRDETYITRDELSASRASSRTT